ncbi:MAG: DUF1499 domain-containing protein [Gammaproteobacteria bacterium]|nr:DUF1499 domain-containing protein [Gammaproteobacteria bacterium]MCY4322842.1 DUF1499 domain-containing protein [Gammaproteobacteria bacterium]
MTEAHSKFNRVARVSLVCGVLGVLLPIVGALGTRIEVWSFIVGAPLVLVGFLSALSAVILGVIAMLRLRQIGGRLVVSAHGAALGLLICLYLGGQVLATLPAPLIHNVSTDLEDPPTFTLAPTLRPESSNSLFYESERIGPIQREAYPDLKPLVVAVTHDELHRQVKRVLEEMGMTVTRDDPVAGEIEAIATTFWFGFEDDLVVRLREVEDGTRMDMRSVSRVGLGDMSANANRIAEVIERVHSMNTP